MKDNALLSQDWYDFVHAKRIVDYYPKVVSVQIRIELTWSSKVVREYDLRPDASIHLSIDCLNPNCTSKFVMTGILEETLRTGASRQGVLSCNGRETSKPGAYSCSCMLDYSIELVMKE